MATSQPEGSGTRTETRGGRRVAVDAATGQPWYLVDPDDGPAPRRRKHAVQVRVNRERKTA